MSDVPKTPLEVYHRNYLPARLVNTTDRWYITFTAYNPATRRQQVFKRAYGMNRIRSKTEKRKYAMYKVKAINLLLPFGYPFEVGDSFSPNQYQLLTDAVTYARELKSDTDRKNSLKWVNTFYRAFMNYLEAKNKTDLRTYEFTRAEAYLFLDWLRYTKIISNTTWNNYLIKGHTLFEELKKRDVVEENPFKGIKKRREEKKQRRNLKPHEQRKIAQWAKRHDPQLYKIILLIYYGFIRPGELARLQYKHLKPSEATVVITAKIAKSRNYRRVTLPDPIMDQVAGKDFHTYNNDLYLFGAGLKPSLRPCGHNTMNNRHRRCLEKLVDAGALDSIEGLSLYSWKDTGITDLSHDISMRDVKDNAGHTDQRITEKYYHKRDYIESIREYKKGPGFD